MKKCLVCGLFLLVSIVGYAEYHGFNTAYNSDGIVQDVRWPYWAETTYNAIYSQTLVGSDGGRCYFYGGMPSAPNNTPPCSIIWSFWPPSNTSVPGAAVTAEWTAPNMFAPPHVGEGASGKASGDWPLITAGRWYREVLRVWQPVDGTPHLGFIARWLRDSDTGIWYHLATMRVPFAATGISTLSGFQEDFIHKNRNPRRTDYRNVYYRKGGAWQMANQFTASVRQATERGTAGLIDGDTAAFFEVSMDPNYTGNLNYDAGQKRITLTIANQPPTPSIDPIVVSASGASVVGDQLMVYWQLPTTSSPQFAYQIEVFDNAGYTGFPQMSVNDIDPELRQKMLDVSGIATPHVRLTITDIFNVDSTPILLAPASASLSPANAISGAVSGLDYKYYEKTSDFNVLPSFASLTPVLEGAVNDPDLTIRDQREHYAFNFTGYIEAPIDGIYTFTLHSSDGSRLVIDGATVVDWDGQHSPGPMSGWVALQAGKHAVNLQYFFDNQNRLVGDLIDSLSLSWSGPGFASPVEVPVDAWYRVPAGGEPIVVLSTPADGVSISGAEVSFVASVTANGASLEKVQFYIGDTYWGEDTTAPFEMDSLVWVSSENPIRARLFYNAGHTLDSAQNLVDTTNMALVPWELSAMSKHTYPQGARILNGTYSLIGDGLNFMGREVTGDCTIVAHVADIISTSAGPDGETPDRSWEAGIIMRESTVSTPGMPLGNTSDAEYAAVFATVNDDTRYQDGTMSNAGGPYWSSGLGGQRWLKLQRVGSTFTTFVSTDGSTWTQVNSLVQSGISATLHVGFFTYAGESQNPNVHRAAFDSVSIVGNVTGPPDVVVAPSVVSVYVGQSTTFTALPSGNAPFSYQWQYNGVDLAGETAETLSLVNLQSTDSGLYTVIMNNAAGSASSSATLGVVTPLPVVSEILSNNPLGYWRLNDTGPTAEDDAGFLDGTGQGGVAFETAGADAIFGGFGAGNLAAQFNGVDSSIAIPPLGITTTHFTITGWVKRNGTQNYNAGLVYARNSGRGAGVFVKNNNLRFGWNDDGSDYNWDSGLFLPDGQWTFFALTIEPTKTILYTSTDGTLNSATRSVANNSLTINGSFNMGYDPNSSTRRLKGDLDEIAIYNRTLTSTELQGILDVSRASFPSITFTSPMTGAEFSDPSNIDFAASVTANGHVIDKVQFFDGSNLIGEDATAPFGLTWSNVGAGNYTLLAKLIYDGGSILSAAPVTIRVVAPPSVALNPLPADGATNVVLNVQLGWTAGSSATSHEVYFGTNSVPAFQGSQTGNSFDPGSLLENTTYYWRVNEVGAGGTTTGEAWSFTTDKGQMVSFNFVRNAGEAFAGGELIGPLASDSTYWNSGTGASGSQSNLMNNVGSVTRVNIQWQSTTLWNNGDGTGDDEHRLSTGYLDDGNTGNGKGVAITLSNIPYSAYRIYGLFSTDSGSRIINYAVNGAWVLGGTASTTAAVYENIQANHAAHGEYWTEIEPSVVQGNYWTGITTGTVCTVVGEDRASSSRGCLTGLIIEEVLDADNDGIPNDWEIANGLNPLLDDRTDDPDADAQNNWFEYITDTDPQNSQSMQTFSLEVDAQKCIMARFNTSACRRYTVEYSTNLTNQFWMGLVAPFDGTGSEMTVPDTDLCNERFYRLLIELPAK